MDWDVIWADVHWIRDCFDHIRLEDHQVCVVACIPVLSLRSNASRTVAQRVNHFKNHYELTRKDHLVKNIKRMKKQLERADAMEEASKYSFLPTSFVLPAEYGAMPARLAPTAAAIFMHIEVNVIPCGAVGLFVEAFKREPGGLWIMKPVGKAQGKGIFLFTKLSDIKDWKKDHTWKSDAPQVCAQLREHVAALAWLVSIHSVLGATQAEAYVVQKYIENPYTIGGTIAALEPVLRCAIGSRFWCCFIAGKKFDMRVYALVTSHAPLTVWLYRTGFGRFSNTRYTVNHADVDNLCACTPRSCDRTGLYRSPQCLMLLSLPPRRHALDQCGDSEDRRELPEQEGLQAEPAQDQAVHGQQARPASGG